MRKRVGVGGVVVVVVISRQRSEPGNHVKIGMNDEQTGGGA